MHDNGKEAGTSLPTVFEFGNNKLRTTVINKSNWFHAQDVCNVLGIKNARDVVSRTLDDDEKDMSEFPTRSGVKQSWVINESGLWAMVLRSNKPSAKAFRKWVTSEVLPALREKGNYSTNQAKGISEDSTNNEGQAYSLVFGRHMLRVAHADGHTWIGLYGLGKLLNVPRSLRYYLVKEWFNASTHRNMKGNSKDLHMINAEGFGIVLARLRKQVDERIVDAIYKQVYKTVPKNVPLLLEFPTSEAEYQFTYAQMNEIFTAVGVPPFNRGQVMKLLSNGKRA
jgi:prophage antirepressor-like protein